MSFLFLYLLALDTSILAGIIVVLLLVRGLFRRARREKV